MTSESEKRPRGRPRASARLAVSEVAFRLFGQNGYAATTMPDIAAAAGISAPTLFRYFPSKAAILWDSYAHNVDRFDELLRQTAPDVPVVDAVFAAYRDMLAEQHDGLDKIKSRVALIANEPEEVAATWDNYGKWTESVAAFVARTSGASTTDLEPLVVGGMIWSGLWGAIIYWSRSDDADPSEILERARQLFGF